MYKNGKVIFTVAEFTKEHRELCRILKTKDPKGLNREYRDQHKELMDILKQNKK